MQYSDVILEFVKGNELQRIEPESISAFAFQATLKEGLNLDTTQTLQRPYALLGTRGDYLLAKLPYALGTGTVDTRGKNSFYLEMVEFTAVPERVQNDMFGKFSPFATSEAAVDASAFIGIDKQLVAIMDNVGFPEVDAADATVAVQQKIRGVADPRITAYYALADPTSADSTAYIKIKPSANNVFYIPPSAKIWVDQANGAGETAV